MGDDHDPHAGAGREDRSDADRDAGRRAPDPDGSADPVDGSGDHTAGVGDDSDAGGDSADNRDRPPTRAPDSSRTPERPSDERLGTLFADLWETLEAQGDPAALSAYLSSITAGDWKHYSDREMFELLLDSVFAPGDPWPVYEQHRSAVHAALGDYRRVAGFDEADVDRLGETPALQGDRGRVRVAVVNARRFAAVVHRYGSFRAYLERLEGDGERALAAVGQQFALGARGVREFLGNLGYRPVVRRETTLGRTLARVGAVSHARAYDEVDAAVTRIADSTHRRWTVVDRVFWCHGFGPDVVGLGGAVCGEDPNCWACLVEGCPSRQDPLPESR